ncbi:MAG: redoxin domain-containing protein [Armatimonadota bacterium]|nr:redoxin domain-containing protein [Armatimonadota bacterium]
MKSTAGAKIKDHALVPQFDLPATGGRRAMTWGYKGLRNLVIVFLPDIRNSESRRILQDLAKRYSEYRDHNAEILVVSKDNIETLESLSKELGLPFPLASDVDGSVTESYTELAPATFVLDRYGELYAHSEFGIDREFPDYQQILDWLHLIELQCPECGIPTWGSG